jgi:hypothetical protein
MLKIAVSQTGLGNVGDPGSLVVVLTLIAGRLRILLRHDKVRRKSIIFI